MLELHCPPKSSCSFYTSYSICNIRWIRSRGGSYCNCITNSCFKPNDKHVSYDYKYFLCHWADRMAEDGNARGIDILNTINTFGWAIGEVIAGFLGIYFGVELVQK